MQVVEFAHKHDVTVEGELGVLAGIEDEVSSEHTLHTRPEEVEDFVKKTGVDSICNINRNISRSLQIQG